MHVEGKAIDFYFKGVNLRLLRDEAWKLGIGGVGYYPKDGFIHIDTGEIRKWGF